MKTPVVFMDGTQSKTGIVEQVRSFYEQFPYPHYPLFAKPYWQDGYLASSWFAAQLFREITGEMAAIHTMSGQFVRHSSTILVAGSGEILPYVIRKFEPGYHRILCVDLSKRSLKRARFRLWNTLKPVQFIHSDINDFIRCQGRVSGPFSHIDAFGVLHHLANPLETIQLLAHSLDVNGTLRVMVYNKVARQWIYELKKAFWLLKLNPYDVSDRRIAKKLLKQLADISPTLERRLSSMMSSLDNDSRFVDTFFHVREARLDLAYWLDAFKKAGLQVYAFFDRYGELDDLSNPLWGNLDWAEIHKRCQTGLFEGNFEFYLYKTPVVRGLEQRNYSFQKPIRVRSTWFYRWRRPPYLWFSFPETARCPLMQRYKLWQAFINHATQIETAYLDPILTSLSEPCIKRLARLGAIFPSQIKDEKLLDLAQSPITGDPPQLESLTKINFDATAIKKTIEAILESKGVFSSRRLNLIMQRLIRSQYP